MAQRSQHQCPSDSATSVVTERLSPAAPVDAHTLQDPRPDPDPALIAEPLLVTTAREESLDAFGHTMGQKPWWAAVERIATLVINEGLGMDNDQALRRDLGNSGFQKESIERALDWLAAVMISGQSNASLSMLLPSENIVRIEHPLEQYSIPSALRQALVICIRKGLMTREFSEKILEGFRNIEARDWGKKEVSIFLFDALSPSLPWLTKPVLNEILSGGKSSDMFH